MTTDTVTVLYKDLSQEKVLLLSKRDGLTGSSQGIVYDTVELLV